MESGKPSFCVRSEGGIIIIIIIIMIMIMIIIIIIIINLQLGFHPVAVNNLHVYNI
jgi:hypothetical protein